MFENYRDAWDAGFAARKQSSELPDRSPYPKGARHHAWLSGWYAADDVLLFHSLYQCGNEPGVVPLTASAVTELTQL